jgi:2-oxoglutarate ferredoxin oxidoreductase subunit beta
MTNTNSFSGYRPTWCPGCGNYGILVALQKALKAMHLTPSDLFVCFGIGCSGNMNDFLNAYAMHSLHGRALPNAIGMKLAQHDKPVVVIAGDGDTYGEGGNHFVHACRGNHDITVIVHDNGVYGLTTGQVSPRANKGDKSKSTPSGTLDIPLSPLALALTQGATFVAQAYAMDPNAYQIIQKGMDHKGFSLINMLQACTTFNKMHTPDYYQEHTYHLKEDHDPTDFKQAIQKAMEPVVEEKFPLGILYDVQKPTYHEQLPQLHHTTLISRTRYTDSEFLAKEFI